MLSLFSASESATLVISAVMCLYVSYGVEPFGFIWKGGKCVANMVTHTRNLCSAFNPSKCTHTVVNIHPEQWAANAAAPGEQLGVRCLAQGSHLSRGIEGGESAVHSLPPPTIPAGPETRTHNLRVTSPTLYPLGHDWK